MKDKIIEIMYKVGEVVFLFEAVLFYWTGEIDRAIFWLLVSFTWFIKGNPTTITNNISLTPKGLTNNKK